MDELQFQSKSCDQGSEKVGTQLSTLSLAFACHLLMNEVV